MQEEDKKTVADHATDAASAPALESEDYYRDKSAEWRDVMKAEDAGYVTEYIGCSVGWDAPLREFFDVVRRLVPDSGQFHLLQVKEKFGGLRIYFRLDGVSAEVSAAISDAYDEAERKCWKTCELTGLPGKLIERQGYYCVRADGLIKDGDLIL